jgi:hypothetical protein
MQIQGSAVGLPECRQRFRNTAHGNFDRSSDFSMRNTYDVEACAQQCRIAPGILKLCSGSLVSGPINIHAQPSGGPEEINLDGPVRSPHPSVNKRLWDTCPNEGLQKSPLKPTAQTRTTVEVTL